MIFDVNQPDLRHKARLVVSIHVVDYKDHTTYSSTIKYFSMRLILLIAVKNGLGLMDGDIVYALYMASYAENIWSYCGAEFGTRCGAVVVIKRTLYGLKTASNSFCEYFRDFLRDLGFTPSREQINNFGIPNLTSVRDMTT